MAPLFFPAKPPSSTAELFGKKQLIMTYCVSQSAPELIIIIIIIIIIMKYVQLRGYHLGGNNISLATAQEGRSFSEQPFLAPVANSWAWTSSRGILLFPCGKGIRAIW
ncbi:predicted protein [Histoplasma capsulatum H143]|uniref:Uncharacterized protein n=1 Tax=Ajellomyces capsulatus (strain H143) TaxID=544712 RepID=C6H919_AJECH|nr:predicted protein [Histoplasma capsulatum H143]